MNWRLLSRIVFAIALLGSAIGCTSDSDLGLYKAFGCYFHIDGLRGCTCHQFRPSRESLMPRAPTPANQPVNPPAEGSGSEPPETSPGSNWKESDNLRQKKGSSGIIARDMEEQPISSDDSSPSDSHSQ